MSYRRTSHPRRALGQAKIVPGQISFATTESGRIPNVQALIEAGLPIAPYIEHGSWNTGQPDIMRYGRDPYRGLFGLGQQPNPVSSAGAQITQQVVQQALSAFGVGVAVVGSAAIAGAAGGLVGALVKRPILMTLLGALGGGAIGVFALKNTTIRTTVPVPGAP